ncbi:MAG TPA: hypothetical protein VHE34_06425 [Puia sp.]|uniref:hypothetical protein n=1 Tax=Puia sp. TaxID=2045100 RepID=UPI002BE7B3E2|nr:hypothetical protein [Puia sp.]HVU94840.1 hypothetical protein [Puia sp.]
MNFLKTVRLRKPARQLADMDVPDTVWKQDFDIADRYQAFANEILRISLLGIAGHVFLIREVLTSNHRSCHTLLRENKLPIGAAAVSLVLAAALVLAHRFFSTACLYHQVLIVRSLKRIGSPNWTEAEKTIEKAFLGQTRKEQQDDHRISRLLLISSALLFATGFACVIFVSIRAFQFA